MSMRAASLLISLVICLVVWGPPSNRAAQVPVGWQQRQDDPYRTEFVGAAFQAFKKSSSTNDPMYSYKLKTFTHSDSAPSLQQLGDSVSVAVLKLYDPKELIAPPNAKTYLTLCVLAFSDGTKIREESDRNPRVTLFVLDYLQDKEIQEPIIEKRIDYLRTCFRDFGCSAQGQYEFLKNH